MTDNSLTDQIKSLNPGDEIIILPGEGQPAATSETRTLVWKLFRDSALTIDGIIISADNISDLIVLQNVKRFIVSDEARAIWDKITREMTEEGTLFENESEPE